MENKAVKRCMNVVDRICKVAVVRRCAKNADNLGERRHVIAFRSLISWWNLLERHEKRLLLAPRINHLHSVGKKTRQMKNFVRKCNLAAFAKQSSPVSVAFLLSNYHSKFHMHDIKEPRNILLIGFQLNFEGLFFVNIIRYIPFS